MATCKECVHVGVCSYAQNSNNEFEHCANFRARSRFVELPCKLGDVIFYTVMLKTYQAVVDRIELYDEGVAIITADGYCVDSTICYHTQEEAEQALKERETDE